MGHASATFTMDTYIHKTETMMDGIKEKLENRNKTKKRLVVKSSQNCSSVQQVFRPLIGKFITDKRQRSSESTLQFVHCRNTPKGLSFT